MPAILDNKSKIYLQLGIGLRHGLEVHHIGDAHPTEYGEGVHKILIIAGIKKEDINMCLCFLR